jgi:hypothetical protein
MNEMKCYARFDVIKPSTSLPAMIGNVSTSSLPLRTWNEFWDKIGRIGQTRKTKSAAFAAPYCLILLVCCSMYLGYVLVVSGLFSYIFLPFVFVVLTLSRLMWGRVNYSGLSGIQAICSEFSASFESAGFSITCQQEVPQGNMNGGCNYTIYIYPTSLDFLRIEIADERLLGCSTTELSIISAYIAAPISAEIVASETWNQFWCTIEREAAAYTVASRRIFALFVLMYIFGVLAVATSSVSIIISYSALVCMAGSLIWECYCHCQKHSARRNIESTVQEYFDLFIEQGINTEFRKEYDWSWNRNINRVNNGVRWCLYMFPVLASIDQIEAV